MSKPSTLIDLLAWVGDPSEVNGLHVLADNGDWRLATYAELADRSRRVAADLLERGLQRDDVVAIVCGSADDFVAAFYGALMAGCTPCPLATPGTLENRKHYLSRIASLLAAASPALAWASPGLVEMVRELIRAAGIQTPLASAPRTSSRLAYVQAPGTTALLQFTSGSTGRSKALEITPHNLQANIAAIRDWLSLELPDAGATWLPFHHDMGLIGGLLTPITLRGETWIMRPDQFLRAPVKWLECFGRFGATTSASPSFGLDHVVRRAGRADLSGLDFSRWRAIIIGAERIDPAVLRRFAQLLAPQGFAESALRPAYGLAEATLAVTGRRGRSHAYRPQWDTLSLGQPVTFKETADACDPVVGNGSGWLVSCGPPLPGCGVGVVDDQGRPLGELTLGELVVKGDSVAAGYRSANPMAHQAAFSPGEFRSGDAGFLVGGELVVVGRIGDSLKIRGKHVYAEDVEVQVGDLLGISVGRVAIAMGIADGTETVIAHIRARISDEQRVRVQTLLRRVVSDANIEINAGPGVPILRTSSGKIRRREMWQAQMMPAARRADANDQRMISSPP
jgi:acyl-CoA synthetase (AMP-forming)/AMP-acid ligase II